MSDPRVLRSHALWSSFLDASDYRGIFGIIHHGDLDGVTAAAYAYAIISDRVPPQEIRTYWVGTEEYDFIDLRSWVGSQALDHCLLFDISIANNPPALRHIGENVVGKTFVFDHHLLANAAEPHPPNLFFTNPTPAPLPPGTNPVPAFLFALKLARDAGLAFPHWLVVLAMFTEGVDSFFEPEIIALAKEIPELQGNGPLRERYYRSSLARAAALVRAAYADEDKNDYVLRILLEVARGHIPDFAQFSGALEGRFGAHADSISKKISELSDTWLTKIEQNETAAGNLVVIPVDASHAVAGPVASIVRGTFPRKVIAAWIERGSRTVVELRTGNSMPVNLVNILGAVGRVVPLLNYGGHPSAAGASVSNSDAERFFAELRKSVSQAYSAAGLSP